jgi:DNA-binding CsgD family transcriptional regulator
MSAPFEALIGNGLQVKAGRLSASDTEAERVLGAAIARATQHEIAVGEAFRWLVVPRRGGLRPLMVQLVPVVGVANDFLNPVSAIVLLTDLEANVTGPEKGVLADAFGLAPAEARLAAQIVAGETLPEIAHREGVSRETLRSRLKSIFEKTGTSRQSELVLLLAKLVGPRP